MKWREVFCEYAKTRDKQIIEKAKAAFSQMKQSVAEAAEEHVYLIRIQAEIDKNALVGQAQVHVAGVEANLTAQAQSHVAGVEANLTAQAQQHVAGVEANLTAQAQHVVADIQAKLTKEAEDKVQQTKDQANVFHQEALQSFNAEAQHVFRQQQQRSTPKSTSKHIM